MVNISKELCLSKLQATIKENPKISSPSQLASLARGKERVACIEQVGGYSSIGKIIQGESQKLNIETYTHSSAGTSPEKDCEQLLINQYRKDFSQKANLSKLTTASW